MSLFGSLALLLFALLGHGYLWVGAVNRLHGWAGPRKLVDGLTLLCCFFFSVIPLLTGGFWWFSRPPDYNFSSATGIEKLIYCYVWLCAALALYKLIERVLGIFPENDKRVLRSHKQVPITPGETLLEKGLIGAYPNLLGLFPGNEVLRPTVDFKQLAIPRLPADLQGLKIAHISDLHHTGRIHGDWFHFVTEELNQVEPDLIAITGDLIEHEPCRDWLNESLGNLKAPGGVYFILGNHDFFIDTERTIADLTSAGLIYLGGRCELTTWKGTSLLLSGYEGPWLPTEPPVAEALSPKIEDTPFRITLLHTPDEFSWACDMNADLVLAGHTHGGQVRLPLLGAVAAPSIFGTRYACGTFLRGQTVMHVTRGLSGETPLRWNCPPEIAVLELVPI